METVQQLSIDQRTPSDDGVVVGPDAGLQLTITTLRVRKAFVNNLFAEFQAISSHELLQALRR